MSFQASSRVTYHRVVISGASRVTNHEVQIINEGSRVTTHRIDIVQASRVTYHRVQIGLSSRVTNHLVSIQLPSRVTNHEVVINRNALPPVYIIPRPQIFNINDRITVFPAIEIYYDNNTNFEILDVRAPFGSNWIVTAFTGTPLPRSYDNVKLLSVISPSGDIPLRVGRHDVYMKYRYLSQETLLMVEKYVYVPVYVFSDTIKRVDHIFDNQFIRSGTKDRMIRDEYRLTISFCEEGGGEYEAIEYADEDGTPLQVLNVLPSEEFVTQRAYQENTASYPFWTLELNNRFPKEKVFEREISVDDGKSIPQHFYVATVMNLRTGEAVCFGNLQLTGETTRFQAKYPKVKAQYKGLRSSWTEFEHFQGGLTITVAHPASLLRGVSTVDQESKSILYDANGSSGKGFLDYLFTALNLSVQQSVNGVLQPTRPAARRVFHFFELCELFAKYLNEHSLLARFGFLSKKDECAFFAGLDQFGFVRYREATESIEDMINVTAQKRVIYQERIDRLEGAIDVRAFIFSRHYGDPTKETPEGIGRRSYRVEVTRGLRDKEGFFTGESENGAEYPYWWGRYETANDLKKFFEQVLRMICDFETVKNADGSYSIQSLWHSLYHDGKYYRFKRETPTTFLEAPFKVRRVSTSLFQVDIPPSSNDRGLALGLRVGQKVKVDGQVMYVSAMMQNTNGLIFKLLQQHVVEPNVSPLPMPPLLQPVTLEVEVGFVREFKFERKLILKESELSVNTNLYSNNGHVINKADVGYKPESRKAVRVLSKEVFGAGNAQQRVDGRIEFQDDFQRKIIYQTEFFNEVRASYQSRLESITVDVDVATRRWEKRFLLEYQPNSDKDIYTPRNRVLIETSYGFGYPVAFYTHIDDEVVFHKYFAEAYQAHVVAMNVASGRCVLDSPVIISLPNKERINSTWVVETDVLSMNGETERLFFVDGMIDRVRGLMGGNMIKMPTNFLPAPIDSQVPMIVKRNLGNTEDNRLIDIRRDGFMLGRFSTAQLSKFGSSDYITSSGHVPIFDVKNREFASYSVYKITNGKREYLRAITFDSGFNSGLYNSGLTFNALYKDVPIPASFFHTQPFDAYIPFRTDVLRHRNPTGRWHVELKRANGEKFYGFFDVSAGVYMARKRSCIRLGELTISDFHNMPGTSINPDSPLFPHEVVFRARFKATASFVLAVIQGITSAHRLIEIKIEPNRVVISRFGALFTITDHVAFEIPEGFNSNEVYDFLFFAGFIPTTNNPNSYIYTTYIVLNEKTYTNTVAVSGTSPGEMSARSSNIGGGMAFGIVDDGVLLYLDYARLDYKKGTERACLYDLSFQHVQGSVAESPNLSVYSTDINNRLTSTTTQEKLFSVVRKYYPNQAALEAENIAAGLAATVRGTLPSNGGWRDLINGIVVNRNSLPFIDPFGECLIINRSIFEV